MIKKALEKEQELMEEKEKEKLHQQTLTKMRKNFGWNEDISP